MDDTGGTQHDPDDADQSDVEPVMPEEPRAPDQAPVPGAPQEPVAPAPIDEALARAWGLDEPDAAPPVTGTVVATEEVAPLAAEVVPGARARVPLRSRDKLVILALVALSAVLHFARLASPGALLGPDAEQCRNLPPLDGAPCYQLIPLDEVHYVPDARDMLTYGTESDTRVAEGEGRSGAYVVHPPVGKWFIAAGIRFFGDDPIGWRFFGALFGTLSTLIAYALALRLWRSPWWAALAAFLLTIEGLWFVQSRVAMLDIYTSVFFLAGFWMLLVDRDQTTPAHRGFRWWRVCGALMFGLALATKWSIGPMVAVATGMAFAWEIVRVRAAERRRWIRRLVTFGATFVLLPVTVYVATFTPWFLDAHRYAPVDCPQRSNVASEWLCYQGEVVGFHRGLAKYEDATTDEESSGETPTVTKTPAHPYFGQAWSWPWIGRPVAHSYTVTGQDATERDAEVLGLPNPLIWWPAFFIALPLLTWWTLRRGDPVAAILFGLIMAGWLPYLAADVVDRPVFLFYATPIVPFLVFGVVHALRRLVARNARARWVPIAYAALALGAFAFFYPVLAALPIPRGGPFGWQAHMWFSGSLSDCNLSDAIRILCWI